MTMPSPQSISSLLMIAVALVFGALAVRARLAGHLRLGLRFQRRSLVQTAIGFALGTVAFGAILGISVLLGVTMVAGSAPTTETIVGGVVVLTVLAMYEELLFRVLLVSGLLAVTRSVPLALVVAVLVTTVNHAFTEGVTILSLISAGLGGLMYSVAYVASKSWWLPLGLHLAWNIVQGPILGYPVSGATIGDGPLFTQHTSGPLWLTGGDYGPEAGVTALTVRVVIVITIILLYRSHIPTSWTVVPGPPANRGGWRS